MKKFILLALCALVLIGCSSSSNTEELNALSERVAELEELNNELMSENTSLKSELSELNTPEPTPTDPYADLTFDDFNPTCAVTNINSVGTLRYEVSITNRLDERSSYQFSIDILYKNNWIESDTTRIRDIPSGIRGTYETLSTSATDGRSERLSDYKCEIVEFNWY